MMTKSDFEAVASVFLPQVENLHDLRGILLAGGHDDTVTGPKAVTLEVTAYNLVQKFVGLNPRFDHKIFYKACGFGIVGNYPRVFPELF